MSNSWKKISLLVLLLVFSKCVFAQQEEMHVSSTQYIVWPEDNESGTFYLHNKPIDGEWKRKGYLRAYSLIEIVPNSEEWVSEKRQSSEEFRYIGFIAVNGASGLIKKKLIKPINEVRAKGNLSLPLFFGAKIVQPINPLKGQDVNIYSISSDKVKFRDSFSRSFLKFVVSYGKEKIVYIDEDTREKYLDASYLMELDEGGYVVKHGWIKKSGLETKFMLIPIQTAQKAYVSHSNLDAYERFKLVWEYWTDPKSFNGNKLMDVIDKACSAKFSVEAKVGVNAGIRASHAIEIAAGGEGKLTYDFPEGNRFTANLYKDMYSDKKLSVLRKIKCKQNSNHDWYTESIDYVLDDKEFWLYQDDLLNAVSQYFITPSSDEGRDERLAMLELKELEGKKLDYYSAYYRLADYLYDRKYGKLGLTPEQKLRLNSFLMEGLVQP